MKKEILVSSMLVDGKTKQFIGEIDRRGIGEFLQWVTKSGSDNSLTVVDFSRLVDVFHAQLDERNKRTEHDDVRRHRATVYTTRE